MEKSPQFSSSFEETIDANPIMPYEQLTHDEIHDISALLRELIEKEFVRENKITQEEREQLREKFKGEKNFMTDNMPDDEFVDFVRHCKRGSPNFITLQNNPHLALVIQERLLPLIPKI